MKIAVYMRVSTQAQKTDLQEADILCWLVAHGHDLEKVQWFKDHETGKHLSRNGLNALAEAIFAGQVDTIIVWKLDRIARSLKDGVSTLSHWCECGIRVISITQQLDLSGTIGQTIASVLFGIAEIELKTSKERQAAGIALAKKRGVYKGRKKGTMKANPQRAIELAGQGWKPQEIANALGVSKRTIHRYVDA